MSDVYFVRIFPYYTPHGAEDRNLLGYVQNSLRTCGVSNFKDLTLSPANGECQSFFARVAFAHWSFAMDMEEKMNGITYDGTVLTVAHEGHTMIVPAQMVKDCRARGDLKPPPASYVSVAKVGDDGISAVVSKLDSVQLHSKFDSISMRHSACPSPAPSSFSSTSHKSGSVKLYDTQKNYGFVTTGAEGEQDYFVHQSNINSPGFRKLLQGEQVEFDVVYDEKFGKWKAVNVSAPGNVPFRR